MAARWSILKDKIVFLDRDGVINQGASPHEYIKRQEDFHLLPGVSRAIQLLNSHHFLVVVITNQRGIARKLMTNLDLEKIHTFMQEQLKKMGAHIDAIYTCPHEKGTCHCRKPEIGLFLQAEKRYKPDKNHSYMIGDSQSDIIAGKRYGVHTVAISENESWCADYCCHSLYEAVQWILQEENK